MSTVTSSRHPALQDSKSLKFVHICFMAQNMTILVNVQCTCEKNVHSLDVEGLLLNVSSIRLVDGVVKASAAWLNLSPPCSVDGWAKGAAVSTCNCEPVTSPFSSVSLASQILKLDCWVLSGFYKFLKFLKNWPHYHCIMSLLFLVIFLVLLSFIQSSSFLLISVYVAYFSSFDC